MIHQEASPLAGKTVKIKAGIEHPQVSNFGGSEFVVEDYWDRISEKSWMYSEGNPACMIYAMRSGFTQLPIDDEVLYGKVGSFGHLVHISELVKEEE